MADLALVAQECVEELAVTLSPGVEHKLPCPLCQHRRRKHPNDKPLAIKVDDGGFVFFCHHCNASGGGKFTTTTNRRTMSATQPAPVILPTAAQNIREEAIGYLTSRGIREDVARLHTVQGYYRFGGREPTVSIGFPYKVVPNRIDAVKWRSADDSKQFSQQNTCEDFYLLDLVKPGQDLLICEGEIDALAWLSSGVLPDKVAVLSIPNGAPKSVRDGKIDPRHDAKFRYVARAIPQLQAAKRIYLNTDNDEPGKALAEELARRIGRDRTWQIDLAPYKDAAEALAMDGPTILRGAFASAKPMPLLGLYQAHDFNDQFTNLYDLGKPRGASTGIPVLDRLMTVAPGMLTVVTGYPGSGKSDLVDQIAVNLANTYGWRTVYCSFEKPTEMHAVQLAEKLVGKPFFKGPYAERMTPDERDWAMSWISDHFGFMDYRRGGPSDIDGILSMASASVLRMGTRMLVIDPYNYIDMSSSGRQQMSESYSISSMLTKVQQWAKTHDCHVMFVAHPAKSSDGGASIPTGHHISGSAAWFAKADIGLSVSRNPEDRAQSAHVWKMKWSWLGGVGSTPLAFNPLNSRWSSTGSADDPFDWSF